VIEATKRTENDEPVMTSWASGVRTGVIYLVRIRTGRKGASLNFRFGSACLSLKLYGDFGISKEIPLRIPMEQFFYLQPNQTDTFEIEQISSMIGQLTFIDLIHNGLQKSDVWCIDWIEIRETNTQKSYR
jgi:hypothetical protein